LFFDKLENYVKIYKGFLNDEICDHAVNELENVEWETHTFYNYAKNDYHSTEKELSVYFNDDITAKQYLMEQTWQTIEKYILKDYNFQGYFDGWSGYTNIRFNRYKEKTNMKLHCDHIHDMFDGERKGIPILSIIGNLNDDYEGGEFVMWENTEYKLGKGDIMIFPSNFLYPHRVNDVTKGTRYSFVSWVW